MKITTFTVALNQGKLPVEEETKVTKYVPPQEKPKGRKYVAKERAVYGEYMENVFYNNELAAYEGKAKTYDVLRYELLKKYSAYYTVRKKFKQHKESIGNLQSRYNRRILYVLQKPVYLVSFRYDRTGYILVDGHRHYTHLTFQECYRRCLDFKVADPRFVPPELLDRLRDRKNSEDPAWAEWSVPPVKWVKSFERKIGMAAYNSVAFPMGYTREETPVDCDL